MKNDIQNFIQQFNFRPEIKNLKDNLKKFNNFIIAGMGGSHLAADLIKDTSSPTEIIVHSNYGLPQLNKEELKKYLFIASSYSGNTEETLDALAVAQKNNMTIAIITAGGKLLEIAQKEEIPYIQLPANDIQPRLAVGYSLIGLLTLMHRQTDLEKIHNLDSNLFSKNLSELAQKIAKTITDNRLIPLIYSSKSYSSLTYVWKININETGKIPTFSNVFPELNHNEMQGFEILTKNDYYKNFLVIMLKDNDETYSANLKRMQLTQSIYEELGLNVLPIKIIGKNYWEKVLSSINLSQWLSFYIAEHYQIEAEKVKLVEKFKKML